MMGHRARIGFIGAGWWATSAQIPFYAARDDVELVAVCRLGASELELVKRQFGFEYATEDYRQLLDLELDGVVISSPHVLHFEHAKAALERGFHVLVEKPVATRGHEARALVELARVQNKQIMIPQGWSFRPFAREARRLAPEIGEPRHFVCQMASALSDLFAGEPMLETAGATFRPPASTWADPEQAGGYGWGQLCHALGLLFGIIQIEPKEVFAWMGLSNTGVDYYDAINLRLSNGATGVISGAATLPKSSGQGIDLKQYQIDIRIFGSEGVMLLDIERERLEVRRNDHRNTIVPLQAGDGAYETHQPLERFLEICLGKTVENDAPGEVAMRAVEVLELAYKSARSGKIEVRA
jgi:predicted dehydrogenase